MSPIQKFLFDGLPVRGSIVRLTAPWQEVLKRRASNPESGAYPTAVQAMLGEMVAGSVLLQSSIRFNGALVLQMQGDGPVKMAVAEVLPDLGLRATASCSGEIPADADLAALVNAHGKGRCAITLDPLDRQKGQQPYQGIVPLADAQGQPLPSVAQAIESYMCSSEQLPTTLLLAANEQVAAGLLLQRLPMEGSGNLAGTAASTDDTADESEESHFQRLSILAQSLKREELLELDIDTILHRLFWNEKILRFAPEAGDPEPHFHCNCSAERVITMLRGLGQAEAESILAEQGFVHVDCNFCGQSYRFDPVETLQIFTPAVQQPPSSQQAQ
ncbi:MAG: Hsp33 family molecular chaperone HslO [Brachymonas sp.]|nr:Hsp33 family molecular chaperone HslO [Brachymonas sp.]